MARGAKSSAVLLRVAPFVDGEGHSVALNCESPDISETVDVANATCSIVAEGGGRRKEGVSRDVYSGDDLSQN